MSQLTNQPIELVFFERFKKAKKAILEKDAFSLLQMTPFYFLYTSYAGDVGCKLDVDIPSISSEIARYGSNDQSKNCSVPTILSQLKRNKTKIGKIVISAELFEFWFGVFGGATKNTNEKWIVEFMSEEIETIMNLPLT